MSDIVERLKYELENDGPFPGMMFVENVDCINEITRLRADKAALVEALETAHDALNDYTDVNDGPYGEPSPNLAMRTREIISAALAQAKACEP